MQGELRVERPDLFIECLGVNAPGHESGNSQACAGRVIPWLQDDFTTDVTGRLWAVTNRDCVLLDADNKVVTVYNLTIHDLNLTVNYNELKGMLIAAAGG
jgi:hypothetical protein